MVSSLVGRAKGISRHCRDTTTAWCNGKMPPKKQRNKIKIEKVQPAHERLKTSYQSELRDMARRGSRALRSPGYAMRTLRSRQHTVDLMGLGDVQRLKKLLKIARMSAYGSIIIDAGLAGQKVQTARDAGGNTEKVAYEEYAALVVGIGAASLAALAVVTFIGPGLIILTLAGGVSALLGAEGGREMGKWLYEQISVYEAAMPLERKKQLLSEVQ